ncbi:MAG TPA: flagellar biosynthesis protein FlhF [Treponema sp.]|nr:flagellar biosynthesis protein FlhF [Treponema sp.]
MDILSEQGSTYDECMARIRDKFGQDIHILRQKKVKLGGILGFFEKDGVELHFMLSKNPYRTSVQPQRPPVNFDDERKKILQQAVKSAPALASRIPTITEKTPSHSTEHVSVSPGQEQLESILRTVKKLEARLDGNNSNEKDKTTEHETIKIMEQLLENNDFSSSYIRQLITRIRNEFTLEDLGDCDRVQHAVVNWIGESVAIADTNSSVRPRVMALVGPTGVGKTTTVAKLAAAYSLAAVKGSRPLRVRVITIDNYRIGAKQQIEIYGNIMNIPVSCAETPSDLQTLIAMYQDVDVILIDTIGKSPKDFSRIAEMRHFLEAAGQLTDVHLAISATTKASDMREIMQQYETFGYGSVIVTKFDETTRVGNIISALNERKKSVAYITTGQRVPQDFEQASVVRFLTNLDGFKINRARIEERFPMRESMFEWR